MSDLLTLAIDVSIVGIGSLGLGYMLWQMKAYGRRAGTIPRRTARLWKWCIVLGLCASVVVFCVGSNDFLLHYGGFEWLLMVEVVAVGGFGVIGFGADLFWIETPQGKRRPRWRAPDDDTQGDPPPRQQQPPNED